MSTTHKKPAMCPDCGQFPPTHHDGSGWYCDECDKYVRNIRAVLALNIAEQRLEQSHAKEKKRRNWRAWYHKHKAELREYHKLYNRLYSRGLRDYGLWQEFNKERKTA